MFGTPPEIRTQNSLTILPFEESDFTNLSRGVLVVPRVGIEPTTPDSSDRCSTN